MGVTGTNEARVIRTMMFRARHHYWRGAWSDEENRRVFGEQCEPHPHDWRVEFHVAGPIDETTGWAVDLTELDAELARLLAGWGGGDLNDVVPAVASGAMTPSTENLARWLFERLGERVSAPVRVVEVRVFESPELGSGYPG
jgi:6-pyruvoyl-tetrahydropterin synthase